MALTFFTLGPIYLYRSRRSTATRTSSLGLLALSTPGAELVYASLQDGYEPHTIDFLFLLEDLSFTAITNILPLLQTDHTHVEDITSMLLYRLFLHRMNLILSPNISHGL